QCFLPTGYSDMGGLFSSLFGDFFGFGKRQQSGGARKGRDHPIPLKYLVFSSSYCVHLSSHPRLIGSRSRTCTTDAYSTPPTRRSAPVPAVAGMLSPRGCECICTLRCL